MTEELLPVPRRLAAHLNTFHPYSFDDALAGAAAAGFQTVEISAVPGWTEHVRYEDDPDAVARRIADHGLEAVALSGHSDLTTEAGVRYAVRGIEWAAAYGLPLFTTAIGGHAAGSEDINRFFSVSEPLVEAAERHHVTVGLEIHGEIMASGALARPLIERLDSRWVGVKYDTGNCEYYGGVAAVDDIPAIANRIVNVDLKDHVGGVGVWNFPEPGAGDLDWPQVFARFSEAGYAGPFSVEIEFIDEVWPDRDGVIAALAAAGRHLRTFLEEAE
jgi:sugar phosphate isomerase/epimerase